MEKTKTKVISRIEPLKPNDTERTMFSAQTANELINAINAFLAMKGAGGIKVHKADAGFVIDGSAITGSKKTTTDPGGTTIINNRADTWL